MNLDIDIDGIIQRIRNGDRQAFAEIVVHYQRPLFGFLGRMAIHQGLAEEIAQETFIRAWSRLGEYQPDRAAFSTWLFTIARTLALNELTRAANVHELSVGEVLPDTDAYADSEQPQPLQALLASEQVQQLQTALRQLSAQDRSVIGLAYVQELDMAAIARIEGESLTAVKTRLHRAKEKLRKLMEKIDGTH